MKCIRNIFMIVFHNWVSEKIFWDQKSFFLPAKITKICLAAYIIILIRHCGRDCCWKKINERYYFYGGSNWVRRKTKECVICAQKRNGIWPAQITPLKVIPVKPKTFWRVHIDLFGKMKKTRTGNEYGVLAVCAFTKYIEAARNIFIFAAYSIARNWFLENATLAPDFEPFKFPVTPDCRNFGQNRSVMCQNWPKVPPC